MMVGELRRISAISGHHPPSPAALWPISILSSNGLECSPPVDLTALNLYPSDGDSDGDCGGDDGGECDSPVDVFSCDDFRMFEFKVRRCSRGRSHDWTDCPYAHPGEKARRRDPRRFHYSGAACADYRKGGCKKGDSCEFAHGVFECWLHPSRYRTQPCKDGTKCRRRVCFFAHTPDQLRLVPDQCSPVSACSCYLSDAPPFSLPENGSPESTPPRSPVAAGGGGSLSRSLPSDSVREMMVRLRGLRLGNVEPWGLNLAAGGLGFPGSFSLPVTPSAAAREMRLVVEKKVVVRDDGSGGACDGPDVGWVSELVK